MKAIVLDEFGGPDVIHYRDMPMPPYGDTEVLIKVHAAGVNPADWKMREGWLAQAFTHQLPVVPGWDLAGTIEAVGSEVKGPEPGTAVYAYNRLAIVQHGSFAEYSIADASMVAPLPANLDFVTASTIPLTVLTAWQALIDFCSLKSGESVLITAGAGGVGGFAIQIARHLGARVCTTASSHNHDYVRDLGADLAIDYRTEDIAAAVSGFSDGGVDVVFDCSGSENVALNFDYIKKGSGRIVTINGLLDTVPTLEKLGQEHGVKAGLMFVEPNGTQLAEISSLLEQGDLQPLPVQVFPLEQAGEALALSEAGHVRGKLALQIV